MKKLMDQFYKKGVGQLGINFMLRQTVRFIKREGIK